MWKHTFTYQEFSIVCFHSIIGDMIVSQYDCLSTLFPHPNEPPQLHDGSIQKTHGSKARSAYRQEAPNAFHDHELEHRKSQSGEWMNRTPDDETNWSLRELIWPTTMNMTRISSPKLSGVSRVQRWEARERGFTHGGRRLRAATQNSSMDGKNLFS